MREQFGWEVCGGQDGLCLGRCCGGAFGLEFFCQLIYIYIHVYPGCIGFLRAELALPPSRSVYQK